MPAYGVSKIIGIYNSDQYKGKEEIEWENVLMFDRRTNSGR